MTINSPWIPERIVSRRPRYRAIADALAEDIASGRLSEGERLPPQRELAHTLGVTVGTVTRAYELARSRGLIAGEVGRGTFVRARATTESFALGVRPGGQSSTGSELGDEVVDLSLSIAPAERRSDVIATLLVELAADPSLHEWCTYQPHAGHPRHRAAGAAWLRSLGVEANRRDVIVCAGAQHGISLLLSALAHPGDAVLTESLTYPGVRWIAKERGLRLVGVAQDDEGLCPDALEARARQTGARVVYCTPTLQNPTVATMSEQRRIAIAEVVRKCDLMLIEDDVYRPMLEQPPVPLANLAPERSFFVTSLSKGITPGLRVGFVRAPSEWARDLAGAVRTRMWVVSPLAVELAARVLESDAAEALSRWKRSEAAKRHELALRYFPREQIRSDRASLHMWLPLPSPWRGAEFASRALERGVRLSADDTFAVGPISPGSQGVRLSLMSPTSLASLERALERVSELLDEPVDALPSVL